MDAPGLNTAIRGVGRTAIEQYDMQILGFQKGFRGIAQNHSLVLNGENLAGILKLGGTILGISRDKPHKISIGGKMMDMTAVIRRNLSAVASGCAGLSGRRRNTEKRLAP